jgi:hypothetical protein
MADRSEQPLHDSPLGLIAIKNIYRERFLTHGTSAGPNETVAETDSSGFSPEKEQDMKYYIQVSELRGWKILDFGPIHAVAQG